MPVIKPEFAFLQVKIENFFPEPAKPNQSGFSKAPEALYPIDMCVLVGKFVMGMLDSKVLLIPQIDKAIISSPTIGVDDALKADSTADNSLECRFRAVRDNFRVHLAITLDQAKNNSFPTGSTPLTPLIRRAPK